MTREHNQIQGSEDNQVNVSSPVTPYRSVVSSTPRTKKLGQQRGMAKAPRRGTRVDARSTTAANEASIAKYMFKYIFIFYMH